MFVDYGYRMKYKIGNDGLELVVNKEPGHADLMRGNVILICLTNSEYKTFMQYIIDAATKKQALLDISAGDPARVS